MLRGANFNWKLVGNERRPPGGGGGTPLYDSHGDVRAVQGMLFYLSALIDGLCNFAQVCPEQCTCPLSKAGL